MPTREQLETYLRNCETINNYMEDGESPYEFLQQRIKNDDETVAYAKKAQKTEAQGQTYWKNQVVERNETRKLNVLSAHAILKAKIEEREANPPTGGLFAKIKNFFQKSREKRMLNKMEKEMKKYNISKEEADVYDAAAKQGFDENGDIRQEVIDELASDKKLPENNGPENKGPETQEEMLMDINEKVNNGPEFNNNNLENSSPAVTNEKVISNMEDPNISSK